MTTVFLHASISSAHLPRFAVRWDTNDQLPNGVRRPDRECGLKQLAAARELAQGLRSIALCEVSPDECGMCGLTQRLKPDSGQCRLDRFRMAILPTELVRQVLHGMQTQVAQAFAVIYQPVVIPERPGILGVARYRAHNARGVPRTERLA
jgi:hypothetical protein